MLLEEKPVRVVKADRVCAEAAPEWWVAFTTAAVVEWVGTTALRYLIYTQTNTNTLKVPEVFFWLL